MNIMFQVLVKISQKAQAPLTLSESRQGSQISLVNADSSSLTPRKVLYFTSHGHMDIKLWSRA